MYSESGIYCYKNKKNGKLYIGQATNLKTRYVSFYNTNRRYAGKVIDNARKKYGVENFEYSILTHCPVDELNYWECFYVERLKTITPYGYNMTYGGDSSYTTTEYFINKQKEILIKTINKRNPKIITDNIIYKSHRTKVLLICPEHGEFWLTPNHILNKSTNKLLCPHCVKEFIRKKTETFFFKKAKEKWGNKYDYSKTLIKSRINHVTITCPIHGDFVVIPGNHISKGKNVGGCPKCSQIISHKAAMEKGEKKLLSIIKEKFGNKYSLEKFKYKGDKEKVTLICPKHGEFSMTYNNLINSKGCPQCTKENAFKNKKNGETNESVFITEAKKIHGDKYDYSKVIYKNSHAKICIVCPEHGEFYQTPNNHLSGYGCAKCGNKNHNVQKKILQYDLNGNFIKEWNNCQEIINSGIGKSETNIRKCCLGSQNVAYNFIWKYKKTDVLIEKHILQLTKNNVLVKEWDSMSQIKKEKPINSTQHIFPCLNGKTKTAGGFIWKYKNN